MLVGVTGYGVSLLFILHGAPDLALTQMLVETVTLVVFVLALRRLPTKFTDRPLHSPSRTWRIALGVAVGASVGAIALVASGGRSADARVGGVPHGGLRVRPRQEHRQRHARRHPRLGHPRRGVGARGRRDRHRQPDLRAHPQHPAVRARRPRRSPSSRPRPAARGCTAGGRCAPEKRSVIFEVVTRLVFHVMLAASLFLLFAGHNQPGGGFAGGLVAGLALVVRYLAGGRYELDEAAPFDAGLLVGLGLLVAVGSAVAPLAFGGTILETTAVDFTLPPLGRGAPRDVARSSTSASTSSSSA